jgi:UDP-galactopyranose mutase
MKYDYLIVGAGLFGATFARQMTDAGKKCLVIDKRSHIGGNCYTENMYGINVHMYGPHIFHTSSPVVWEYVNRFATFNDYRHDNAKAVGADGKTYSLPFNLNTFYEVYGASEPSYAKTFVGKLGKEPENLEEQAIDLVGETMYRLLIKEYTAKQWGRDPKDLPVNIIKRLPVRFKYDNNYYNDTYQGIPIGGYTQMFERMLEGIEVTLGIDFFSEYGQALKNRAKKVVYTGPIDQYFGHKHGVLDYRTMKFYHSILSLEDAQGTAQVNYCRLDYPFTRTIEHKHFDKSNSPYTVITYEYPEEFGVGKEPYYPVNDNKNQTTYERYRVDVSQENNVIFGGRLAEYKYMDMHVVIASAMNKAKKELEEK